MANIITKLTDQNEGSEQKYQLFDHIPISFVEQNISGQIASVNIVLNYLHK